MPSSRVHPPTKSLLFFALLWRKDSLDFENFKQELFTKWGQVESQFEPGYFPMTTYYEKEMGAPLARIFLVLSEPREREVLTLAKKWSMEQEQKYSLNDQRCINIDPGLLCREQALLISTKPYSHRIYIADNLYIELTYQFEKGSYKPLPWTYPDYTHQDTIEFFNKARKSLFKTS